MRPFDPRLVRDIEPVRGAIGITAVISFVSAIVFAVQAIALSWAVATAFLERRPLTDVSLQQAIAVAGIAWAVRAVLTAFNDAQSRRFGLLAVARARRITVEQVLRMPTSSLPESSGGVIALLTRGVDGIETYVARYLPQLVIAAIVPLGLGGVILWLDPLAAVVLLITIPLIPLFMALIGWFTQSNVQRHWQQVTQLSATIADLMQGLPELKIFGRAKAQAEEIRRLGREQQTATIKLLRISFLSGFVLELLATLSVAIIAVEIGLRLTNGHMVLWHGLAALVIAPEVYAPLRMLGVHFHAAAEGLEAWERLNRIRDITPHAAGSIALPSGPLDISWSDLTCQLGETEVRIPAGAVQPGRITAVVGPSGCGKSTLLQVLIGNVTPTAGTALWNHNTPTADIDPATMIDGIGYVSQAAWLGEGSLREVLSPSAQHSDAELRASLQRLGLDLALDTAISDRDQGISVGQRRRIAISRALLANPRVLLLDEPGAALDSHSEAAVNAALADFARNGGAVLVVAHRRAVLEIADDVVRFPEVTHEVA